MVNATFPQMNTLFHPTRFFCSFQVIVEELHHPDSPAWHLNYKGEGHFLGNQAAQKDWTIRMMQFFDYYLKGTKEPRWMKEGIHLRERGIDQKYDY